MTNARPYRQAITKLLLFAAIALLLSRLSPSSNPTSNLNNGSYYTNNEQSLSRWLAAAPTKGGDYGDDDHGGGHHGPTIDYNVLSVAVITLGVIMIVELLRHQLDHAAVHHPFSETLLEVMYRELSTLGIVESVIFILHKYWSGLPLEQEQVFAEVHFCLFFTAVFNAICGVCVAFTSMAISRNKWNKAEYMCIHHYQAVKEEYKVVYMELHQKTEDDVRAEEALNWSLSSAEKIIQDMKLRLFHPRLKQRHDVLLNLIRLQELRRDFLMQHDLPSSFKVSSYLESSLLYTLQKFVEISTLSWLLLMGIVNLIYYFMNVVQFTTDGNSEVVGLSLSVIYLGYCVTFVGCALIIMNKMKKVYSEIMHTDWMTLKQSYDEDGKDNIGASLASSMKTYVSSIRREKTFDQLSLFWFHNPHHILFGLQCMQFGYAIGGAILLVFWDAINHNYAMINPMWLPIVLSLTYVLFCITTARVLRRYALCTSVGQLVNQKRLNQLVSTMRLKEEAKKRKGMMNKRKGGIEEGDTNTETSGDDFSLDDTSRSVRLPSVRSNPLRNRCRHAERCDHICFFDALSNFLQSHKWKTLSATFGTTLCLLFLGMHMEKLLIESGVKADHEYLWEFGLSSLFWMVVSWLGSFILESILVLILVLSKKNTGGTSAAGVVVSAIFDFLLNAGCLGVFMWAESERCCSQDAFGSRVGDGLGNIEPFTVLFSLRVFRFAVARWVDRMGQRQKQTKPSERAKRQRRDQKFHNTQSMVLTQRYRGSWLENRRSVPEFHVQNATKFENSAVSVVTPAESGTAIELWQTAISKYPLLVEKYGVFSSEVLQAMLGIEIVHDSTPRRSSLLSNVMNNNERTASEKKVNIPHCYQNLDEGCQSIIAGGLKRKSKLNSDLKYKFDSSGFDSKDMPVVMEAEEDEDEDENSSQVIKKEGALSSNRKIRIRNADDDVRARVEFTLTQISIADPDATLVRSMRRCEQRLPPTLNDWTVVDVVVTEYELIYLAVDGKSDDFGGNEYNRRSSSSFGIENLEVDDDDYEEADNRRTVRDAIVATKGGKGLCLGDVIVGRTIIGQVLLADIDQITVDRISPSSTQDKSVSPSEKILCDEYWKPKKKSLGEIQIPPYEQRWCEVEEDRMKISCQAGTLNLRFLADLIERENEEGPTVKLSQALLWCQSIARICGGPKQLDQDLPHFGNEKEEWRDFLRRYGNRAQYESSQNGALKRIGNVTKGIRKSIAYSRAYIISNLLSGDSSLD